MCMQVKGLSPKPRWGHSATAFTISQRIAEVVIFGGSEDILMDHVLSDTIVLRFGESTLRGMLCTSVCV